jgi:monofunctional biosynthetic peptidoglycan transglycosylase
MMKRLWIISLAAVLLAGCGVSPGAENTLSRIEEMEMIETKQTDDSAISNDGKTASDSENLPGTLLFDFSPGNEVWSSVDDNVMGGVSSSGGQILDSGALLFSGTMSLENNGGFSSLRSPWSPIDLSGEDGVLIRVLGDGNIYRLRIYTTATGRDIAYNSFFETEDGEWTTVYIPFSIMVPTYRGFQVSVGELDSAAISSFGFMLSDKQEGAFSLQVDWIRSVTEAELFPGSMPSSSG